MIRSILICTLVVVFIIQLQLIQGHGLYGQSSGRIRPINLNVTSKKAVANPNKRYSQELYKISTTREKSATFVQSRRFHLDQYSRDIRDLQHPSSYVAPISSSFYSYGGPGTHLIVANQEACRLTSSHCAGDHQCCSGKCRCVKWSIVGKMSCWKKCF